MPVPRLYGTYFLNFAMNFSGTKIMSPGWMCGSSLTFFHQDLANVQLFHFGPLVGYAVVKEDLSLSGW